MAIKFCVGLALALQLVSASEQTGLKSCDKHNDCGEMQWCYFSYNENREASTGFCFADMNHPGQTKDREPAVDMVLLETGLESHADPEITKFQPKGLKVSSLTVQAEEGREAKVVLESGAGAAFSLRVMEETFALTKGDNLDVLTVTPDGDVVAKTKVLAAGSLSAEKGFIINDVPQWKLTYMEDFSQDAGKFVSETPEDGALTTTKCQEGLFMLGGFKVTSKQTIKKTYQNLPKHDRISIRAVFNFIDAWGGETAFMQLSVGKNGAMEYVWTETYDVSDYTNTVDVCGDDTGEGRFSVPVEVSLPHSTDVITVAFGSTLTGSPSASTAFYGVSSLEIYSRDSMA
jgi:hypothetical protein